MSTSLDCVIVSFESFYEDNLIMFYFLCAACMLISSAVKRSEHPDIFKLKLK